MCIHLVLHSSWWHKKSYSSRKGLLFIYSVGESRDRTDTCFYPHWKWSNKRFKLTRCRFVAIIFCSEESSAQHNPQQLDLDFPLADDVAAMRWMVSGIRNDDLARTIFENFSFPVWFSLWSHQKAQSEKEEVLIIWLWSAKNCVSESVNIWRI